MSNLYERLEVSKNASKEVIEKAYRVLAKKYHPDLQNEQEKKQAEKKMQELNEAYEILSNEETRRQYDLKLEQEEQEKLTQEKLQQKQEEIKQENMVYTQEKVEQEAYQQQKNIQAEMKNAYKRAYYDYLRSLRL